MKFKLFRYFCVGLEELSPCGSFDPLRFPTGAVLTVTRGATESSTYSIELSNGREFVTILKGMSFVY